MIPTFEFTFAKLKKNFEEVLKNDYKVLTCLDYISWKKNKTNDKILVNRVDIDWSCKKAKVVAEIFNDLNIKASFFVRLHADEYNPFAFENYRCLKYIRDTGHEIGYHSEIIDQGVIWNENPADCLLRDVAALNNMLNIKITGVASHGGITGLNNLDFWKTNKPADFGLLYEAYDQEPEFNLFHESLYVSESNYKWKCYQNGTLQTTDKRSLGEHAGNGAPLMYSIIHPETFFKNHIYE